MSSHLRKQLLLETQRNTSLLNKFRMIKETESTAKKNSNDEECSTRNRKFEIDYKRLKGQCRANAKEIKRLRSEAKMLRSKYGHVSPPSSS